MVSPLILEALLLATLVLEDPGVVLVEVLLTADVAVATGVEVSVTPLSIVKMQCSDVKIKTSNVPHWRIHPKRFSRRFGGLLPGKHR